MRDWFRTDWGKQGLEQGFKDGDYNRVMGTKFKTDPSSNLVAY